MSHKASPVSLFPPNITSVSQEITPAIAYACSIESIAKLVDGVGEIVIEADTTIASKALLLIREPRVIKINPQYPEKVGALSSLIRTVAYFVYELYNLKHQDHFIEARINLDSRQINLTEYIERVQRIEYRVQALVHVYLSKLVESGDLDQSAITFTPFQYVSLFIFSQQALGHSALTAQSFPGVSYKLAWPAPISEEEGMVLWKLLVAKEKAADVFANHCAQALQGASGNLRRNIDFLNRPVVEIEKRLSCPDFKIE